MSLCRGLPHTLLAFGLQDKDEIVNAMRGEAKALGLIDTAENCWSVFIQRVRTWALLC